MADQNIEILKEETLVKMIENSVGSRIFNTTFVKFRDSGEVKDILNDGEYSCAFFVSSILYLFQLIAKPVATVESLKKLIEGDTDWKKIEVTEAGSGDVIFWEKIMYEDGSENAHVGFAISKDEAVSTDYKTKCISKHQINNRKVEGVYRYIWS